MALDDYGNGPERIPTATLPSHWLDAVRTQVGNPPAEGVQQLQNAAVVLIALATTRYYGTFSAVSCNAGDGFRFTDVYASGITNTVVGGSGQITFATPGIYEVRFVVGFGTGVAGKVQPQYNGSNVGVEARALANGDAVGSLMITAVGSQFLSLVNTSGTGVTGVGTITIRRVT